MQPLSTNRFVRFTLCGALTLSSVGLPVLVVACGTSSAVVTTSCVTSCGEEGNGAHRISRPPCRAQVLFFERNATEYLAVKTETDTPVLQTLLVIPAAAYCMPPSYTVAAEESPPFIQQDIPILVSSLLI